MKTIKKEWIKYLEILENIDGEVTNSGASEMIWAIQVAYEAEKAGVPHYLIKEYIDGDLVIVNGIPYSMDGKKIEIA